VTALQEPDRTIAPEESIRAYMAANKPAIGRLVSGTFEIRTLDEAEKLSTMLALHYPDQDRVAAGIWELLSNAVEHGNLGIDFDEKTRLIQSGRYHEEIERRLALEPWRDRVAVVMFRRTTRQIRLRVTDEGEGFDFNRFLSADPPMDRPNGRGIAIATRLSFDRVTYRGCGTCVDAIVSSGPGIAR
jgi:anti-sigma regulatory factor (Ser/Thr protein kinase)